MHAVIDDTSIIDTHKNQPPMLILVNQLSTSAQFGLYKILLLQYN